MAAISRPWSNIGNNMTPPESESNIPDPVIRNKQPYLVPNLSTNKSYNRTAEYHAQRVNNRKQIRSVSKNFPSQKADRSRESTTKVKAKLPSPHIMLQ